jgi:signal transduction histidine kinase
MFKFLFPDFEDKNLQIKHNTLISYALFLLIQTFFAGYATFNVGPGKLVFIVVVILSLTVPSLVIYFSRRNYTLVSYLFICTIWTSSTTVLLLFHGDNSAMAFLVANIFIISALASLTIRWYVGFFFGFGSFLIAILDIFFEKSKILNFYNLSPIPDWAYFLGFSIMLGTMLIMSIANALSFENIFSDYHAELKKRLEAEHLLISQNALLDEKVKERTNEIKGLNIELTTANAELSESNKEIAATNEELLAMNEELYTQREELEHTINKLRIAQENLVRSEKMASLGVLAAGVAHEINNPLNFIQGGVDGIENYVKDDLGDHYENVRPLIDAIHTGVSRAAGIVKSLSRFSRQTDSRTEKCDIHAIINNCLVILHNETVNRIEIQKVFTGSSFTFIGNEGKLHQAILNILSNAVQAIHEKGKITISTWIQDQKVFIGFQDTGHGIKKDNLSRVFDPFFTTKAQGEGTGLGLSISYQLLQEFQGSIEIKSESEQGTNVIITLPIVI